MNPATWEEMNGRIEKQERPSRQHERLQARACSYSEAARGERHHRARRSVRQQILDGLIADKAGVTRYRPPPEFWPRLSPGTPRCSWSSRVRSITSSRTTQRRDRIQGVKPARWLQAGSGDQFIHLA